MPRMSGGGAITINSSLIQAQSVDICGPGMEISCTRCMACTMHVQVDIQNHGGVELLSSSAVSLLLVHENDVYCDKWSSSLIKIDSKSR